MAENEKGDTFINPLPEKTGRSEIEQKVGEASMVDLIRPDKLSPGPGISTNLMEGVYDALSLRNRQLSGVVQVVAQHMDQRLQSALCRGDELQEKLMNEKVNHAHTDERLRLGNAQSAAQRMLQIFGAASFAYGLSKLEASQYFAAGILVSVGVVMILVACWPIITLRWRRNRG
jgi:hypothetical protein